MIKIENLNFTYGNSDEPALKRVNLEVAAGELVLITGSTGSGKSTFLKTINGLAPHFTGGRFSGIISISGQVTSGKAPHELAELVGYVNQQPEGAFATDTVEEELAFGLEQLGWAPDAMRVRVNEVADWFGISVLLQRPLVELSGGQQQKVAIASALAAGQKVLLLDEPTSALDSTAALELVELLRALTKELGITVILAEHRFEKVLTVADRILLVSSDGAVTEVVPSKLQELKAPRLPRIRTNSHANEALLLCKGLSKSFGYFDALEQIDLNLRSDEITAVVGENGAGKTTLLWEVLRDAWHQGVEVAMVPQNAADLLFLGSVSEELEEADRMAGAFGIRASQRLADLAGRIDPSRHPRDLSAGQQLALVIAIQLAKNAKVIILDEPTRGLDDASKRALATALVGLRDDGCAILVATHDLEFLDGLADVKIMLNKGALVEEGHGREG